MIKINLVPEELLAKEIQRQRALQAALVAGVVCLVVVCASMIHVVRVNHLESLLRERDAKLKKLQEIVAQVEQLERDAAAVKARLGVITALLKGRPLYPYFMMDIAKTLPPEVWLGGLTTTSKEGNQLGVGLSASSLTSPAIAEWIRNLERSGLFLEPVLGSISVSGTSAAPVHGFAISTTYKHPGL